MHCELRWPVVLRAASLISFQSFPLKYFQTEGAHDAIPKSHKRLAAFQDTYVVQRKEETPADRNHRAIRQATAWYQRRISGKPIVLLTADDDSRRQAREEGLLAVSMEEYVSQYVKDNDLLDLVARYSSLLRPEAG